MKRKAQTAEFKPPMQRMTRLNRRNSRENTSSGKTAEIQPTDTKQVSAIQCTDNSPNADEQELDSDLVEIHSGLEQPDEPNDIIYKLQDYPEGVGMEEPVNETEDTSSPKRQTSYEVGDDMLVNLEDLSVDIAVPSKVCEEPECLKSPPKKRLRRRMGMCGLGDRKRRNLIEGQQSRQSPAGANMDESAEATGKENWDVLKDNSAVEIDGSVIVDGEGAAEPVLVKQNHSSLKQMMTERASSIGREMHEVQDLPSVTAMASDHETDPNLSGNRTSHEMVSEGSEVIADCFVNAEMHHGPTGLDMEISIEQKRLPEKEYPVDEDVSHGCTDVTEEDFNKDSKQTAKHSVEVPENSLKFASRLDTNEQITEKVTSGCSYITCEVLDGFTSAPVEIAEKMDYASTGTYEVPDGSKVISECVVDGSTDIEEICQDSTEEDNEGPTDTAEEVSHGSGCVAAKVCEASAEPTEHPINEVLIHGSTTVSEACESSTEPLEHPVDDPVICLCVGFKDPTENPGEVAKDGSNGSFASVSSEVPEGSKEPTEYPVADRGIYGSTSVTEVSENSREPTVHTVQVTEEVTNGPIYFIKVCEGSELAGLESHGSTAVTSNVCEGSKEPIGHPPQMAEEVGYAFTAIDNKGWKGSKKSAEHLAQLAEEKFSGAAPITNEVSKCSQEPTGHPVHLTEKEHYGTSPVTDEVGECYEEPTGHAVQVDEGVTHGVFDLTNKVCEGSKELTELPVNLSGNVTNACTTATNKASEGFGESTGCPFKVVQEESYGCNVVTNKIFECSKEPLEQPVKLAEEESYCANPITKEVSEGSQKPTGHPVQVDEGVTCDAIAFTNKVCEGSKELTEHPVYISGSVTYGCTTVTNEGSGESTGCQFKVVEEGSCTVVTKEVSEGSQEPTAQPVQVDEGVTCDAIAFTNKVCEGSKELTEHPVYISGSVTYGCTTVTNEGSGESTGCQFKVVEEGSCTVVTKEVSEGSQEPTGQPVQVDEVVNCGAIALTNISFEGSDEPTEHPVHVSNKKVTYGCTTVTNEVSECSKEPTEQPVKLADEESYCTNPVTKDVSEGSQGRTGHPVQVAEGVTCASEGSLHLIGHPAQKAEKVTYGSTTIADEVCEGSTNPIGHPVQVTDELINGSTTIANEASKGSTERTENPVQVAKEGTYSSTTFANEVCEGSTERTENPVQVAEKGTYGSITIANEVCEVTKEVQEAISALEESGTELDRHCPPDMITHLFSPSFPLCTVEQDPSEHHLSMQTNSEVEPVWMENTVTGLTASTEAVFSEICETASQFEHVELTQKPTTSKPMSTELGEICSSSTERLRGPVAPPTDQDTCMQDLLSQDVRDFPVTSAVAKHSVYNPTLTLAVSQDHNNIPSSLYSVTDSQLNSVALDMELEERPIPEGFVHQKDATELVCGLIKELSSLNRMVMATHKEMEVLRRGNRPPKAPIRRTFDLRNSEI